jgi:thioredoxin reductase
MHRPRPATACAFIATTVDRVYAAGNCAEPRALVPTAAGSGVTAAVSINVRLTFEDADTQ